MTRIALLGSTGSIGTQTIDVVQSLGDEYQVVALAAGRNVELLAAQMRLLRPELVAVADEASRTALIERVGRSTPIEVGPAGLLTVATVARAELVVAAVTGALGLPPILAALQAGKRVAPANKEPLVIAGELIMALSRRNGQPLVPIDSEHSAIYQCLRGEDPASVARLILTASGGPFRGKTRADLAAVGVAEALAHPTWKMGPKITIDSSTLMNKGLEVIEARWLFGLPVDQVDVLLHPQSIIHSMVEFRDGSVLAQMDYPDMRTPIQFALTFPARQVSPRRRLDLAAVGQLTFEPPDFDAFPCLGLAYAAARAGGTLPAVMNAANEVAVDRFLAGELRFLQIAETVETVMHQHEVQAASDLATLLAADAWARRAAQEVS
ncbi:MAG: 1-deoxy-D-xylulose-5-phosphate reductoisomerase [Fimbriimonadaceae bacterium]|nr:1-deoxy-D-xylulose-5-phosphate reductoisomerase [Fimbriimonadaceae bacterium]